MKNNTFVRRSIIRSRRILSFLNAIFPGPAIPCFWIGVKISLFQKQVSVDTQPWATCKRMGCENITLHWTMTTVYRRIVNDEFQKDRSATYRHRFFYRWISNAVICNHIFCKNNMKMGPHRGIGPSCIALRHGSAKEFQTDTIYTYYSIRKPLLRYWWSALWYCVLRRAGDHRIKTKRAANNKLLLHTTMRLHRIWCIGDCSLIIFPLRLNPLCCFRKQLSRTA